MIRERGGTREVWKTRIELNEKRERVLKRVGERKKRETERREKNRDGKEKEREKRGVFERNGGNEDTFLGKERPFLVPIAT